MSLEKLGKFKCPKCGRIWSPPSNPAFIPDINIPFSENDGVKYYEDGYEIKQCPECIQPLYKQYTPFNFGERFKTTF